MNTVTSSLSKLHLMFLTIILLMHMTDRDTTRKQFPRCAVGITLDRHNLPDKYMFRVLSIQVHDA